MTTTALLPHILALRAAAAAAAAASVATGSCGAPPSTERGDFHPHLQLRSLAPLPPQGVVGGTSHSDGGGGRGGGGGGGGGRAEGRDRECRHKVGEIAALPRRSSPGLALSTAAAMAESNNHAKDHNKKQKKASSHRYPLPEKPRQKRAVIQDMVRPLKQWLLRHRHNPYPTKAEKMELAVGSNMTLIQVSNWFANARRRLKNVVQDPRCSWSRRLRMYNQFVQGNAELLSIASDDSIWNSDDEDEDEEDEDDDEVVDEEEGESGLGEIDVVEASEGESGGGETREKLDDDANRQSKYKKSMLQRFLSDSYQQQQRQQPEQSHPPRQEQERLQRKRKLLHPDPVPEVPDPKRRPLSARPTQVIQPKAIHLLPPPPPALPPSALAIPPSFLRPPLPPPPPPSLPLSSPLPFNPLVLPFSSMSHLSQPQPLSLTKSFPLFPPSPAESQPLPPTLHLLSDYSAFSSLVSHHALHSSGSAASK